MNKRILCLLLCLIAMLSVSAVSAIDDNVTEDNLNVNAESISEDVSYSSEVAIEDNSYSVFDSSVISTENTKGNFTELQDKIKNTPSGGVCDLDKDYEFIDGESTINIDKSMTLDGHNYTINGNFVVGGKGPFDVLHFKITSNNVVIKNINLLRCYSYGHGYIFHNEVGIKWIGNNGCLDNVNIDNYTYINFTGNNFNISNSFIGEWSNMFIFGFNNTIYRSNFSTDAHVNGNNVLILDSTGHISIHGDNNSILNSNGSCKIFGDNASILNSNGSCHIFGDNASILNSNGLCYIDGDNGILKNIKFSNNINWGYSSFVSLYGNNGKIINLTIDSNILDNISYCECIRLCGNNISIINSTISKNSINDGYFIYSKNESCKIINSTFVNNSCYNSGYRVGAIYFGGGNSFVVNSTFVNNSGYRVGAIYLGGGSSFVVNCTFVNNSGYRVGAIYFSGGSSFVVNSTFVNNSGNESGAVYTDNYLHIDNSIFLDNKLNNSTWLNIQDNGFGRLNFKWHGFHDYLINAITGGCVLNNVTYWGSNGLMNTGQSENIERFSGINIVVEFYNSKMELIKNITTTTDSRGEAFVDYKNLIQGTCFVKAHAPDNNYYNYKRILNTTVTSNLNVRDVVKYYGADDRFVATVYDDDGNIISGAQVEFRINGQNYTRITDKNGVASMAINLKSGVYMGRIKYNNSIVFSNVTINPTVEANDLVKMYQNGTQFYAKFLDSTGKALANTDVKFNINGVFYTRVTDDNGVAKLSINLMPKKYILTAINPINGEQAGYNITVKRLAEANDLTKYYKNESKFQAKIYNKDGSLAINKTVEFNINGVFYTRTTDENGIVRLGINLRPGNYVITTIVDGFEIGNNIKVLPTVLANDLNMNFQDGSKFSTTILNGQGVPLPNQNVTFNVNGVFYDRVTDGDGVASLTINLISGEYIITSMWNDYQTGNKITIS